MLCDQSIPLKLKKFYRTAIIILLYGTKWWALRRNTLRWEDRKELKIGRGRLKITWQERLWKDMKQMDLLEDEVLDHKG